VPVHLIDFVVRRSHLPCEGRVEVDQTVKAVPEHQLCLLRHSRKSAAVYRGVGRQIQALPDVYRKVSDALRSLLISERRSRSAGRLPPADAAEYLEALFSISTSSWFTASRCPSRAGRIR